MAKSFKTSVADMEVSRAGRKEKKQKKPAADRAGEGFSLFSKAKDAELEDVFSKGSTFLQSSVPTPTTSKNKPLIPSTKASHSKLSKGSSEEKSRKRKNSDVAEVTRPSNDQKLEKRKRASKPPASASVDELSDDESEVGELVHESLKPSASKRDRAPSSSKKYIPPDETHVDRDRRTVFIGNLPIECAKAKSVLHQLRAHLLSLAPTAKIESVRFRSVPFATPTAALPSDEPGKDDGERKRVKREKERASAWRAQQDVLEGGDKRALEEVDRAQTFIDSKGKRKVAFIKKDFHSELGSCNAYIVFAHPHPDRPKNVTPVLDPFVAARQVLAANGSSFMDRLIRVDSVRLPSSIALQGATTALGKRDAWLPGGTDPKSSLFVGGLDYAAKEEDVRVLFEELVKSERGQKSEGKWVIGVRIVRDKETQLGKGFGYVHLSDRESVDELLAMDSAKLKFSKKPLRLQPCKTLPPSSSTKVTKSSPSDPKATKVSSLNPAPVPKGNPELGEKLKGLSKEDRKLAKSADADRQARRLAKKDLKAGRAVDKEKGAVKLGASRPTGERKGNMKAKKGRVRSEHAVSRMKGTRT